MFILHNKNEKPQKHIMQSGQQQLPGISRQRSTKCDHVSNDVEWVRLVLNGCYSECADSTDCFLYNNAPQVHTWLRFHEPCVNIL